MSIDLNGLWEVIVDVSCLAPKGSIVTLDITNGITYDYYNSKPYVRIKIPGSSHGYMSIYLEHLVKVYAD